LRRQSSCSWAEVQVEADLLGVKVLVDQEVNNDWKLFVDEIFAALLKAGQQFAGSEEDILNLKSMISI